MPRPRLTFAEIEEQRKLFLAAASEIREAQRHDCDPSYVRQVAAWAWGNILQRKLEQRKELDYTHRKRLKTLERLCL